MKQTNCKVKCKKTKFKILQGTALEIEKELNIYKNSGYVKVVSFSSNDNFIDCLIEVNN